MNTSMENTTSPDNVIVDTTVTFTATVFFLPLCSITLILNVLALILLKRSKKLRGNKFYCLVMCLSSSDVVLSASSLILVCQIFIQYLNIKVPYLCFSAMMTASSTVTFSFMQVLIICIERLLAILFIDHARRWTWHVTCVYGLTFVGTVLYTTCIYSAFGNATPASCTLKGIFKENYWIYQISMATVRSTIYCAIVIIYIIILWCLHTRSSKVSSVNINLNTNAQKDGEETGSEYRKPWVTRANFLVPNKSENSRESYESTSRDSITDSSGNNDGKQLDVPHCSNTSRSTKIKPNQLQIPKFLAKINGASAETIEQKSPISSHSSKCLHAQKSPTQNPFIKSSMSINRFRRFNNSMVTVGIIIIVVSVSVLPVVLTNLISAITDGEMVSPKVLEFTNAMIILNPLFDPIVYVIRLKEFRKVLKCNC